MFGADKQILARQYTKFRWLKRYPLNIDALALSFRARCHHDVNTEPAGKPSQRHFLDSTVVFVWLAKQSALFQSHSFAFTGGKPKVESDILIPPRWTLGVSLHFLLPAASLQLRDAAVFPYTSLLSENPLIPHTHTHTHTFAHFLTYTCTAAHPAVSLSLSHTHAYTDTHTYTHTETHAYTLTHTHTHSVDLFSLWWEGLWDKGGEAMPV